MGDALSDTEDRLLEHYVQKVLRSRGLPDSEADTVRRELDSARSWQTRLGRTDGEYGYLRALDLAGLASAEDRDALNEYA